MCYTDSTPSVEIDRTLLKSLGWAPPRLIDATLAALPFNSLPTNPAQRRRWLLYTLLQFAADSRNLDALAWANDERVEAYLDVIAVATHPAEFTELTCWLKHLPKNRAQKYARRRRLLERHRHELHRPDYPSPEAAAEQADDLARVRHLTNEREWDLLRCAAADGLNAVAGAEGVPLGTLKSQLSRCRRRLRQAC
jgi:hypothetical protein